MFATNTIDSLLACNLLLVVQVTLTSEAWLTTSRSSGTRVGNVATMQSTSLQSHRTAGSLFHVNTMFLGSLHHADSRI